MYDYEILKNLYGVDIDGITDLRSVTLEYIYDFTDTKFSMNNIGKTGKDSDIIYTIESEPVPYYIPPTLGLSLNRNINNVKSIYFNNLFTVNDTNGRILVYDNSIYGNTDLLTNKISFQFIFSVLQYGIYTELSDDIVDMTSTIPQYDSTENSISTSMVYTSIYKSYNHDIVNILKKLLDYDFDEVDNIDIPIYTVDDFFVKNEKVRLSLINYVYINIDFVYTFFSDDEFIIYNNDIHKPDYQLPNPFSKYFNYANSAYKSEYERYLPYDKSFFDEDDIQK